MACSPAILTIDLLTVSKCLKDIDEGQFWNKMFTVKVLQPGRDRLKPKSCLNTKGSAFKKAAHSTVTI